MAELGNLWNAISDEKKKQFNDEATKVDKLLAQRKQENENFGTAADEKHSISEDHQKTDGWNEFYEVLSQFKSNSNRRTKVSGKLLYTKHLAHFMQKKNQPWTTEQSNEAWVAMP